MSPSPAGRFPACALLAAMVATSFDATASALGRRRWRQLHVTGLYYLWFVLTQTFATAGHPLSAVMAIVGLAALGLRIAAGRRSARRAPAAA